MSREEAFIRRLATFAETPAARGLRDDVAVLPLGGQSLVLTHDMIVEGVHYLTGDPPEDVAWKLVAVNLSDLAAKGAIPLGLLVGYPLAPDPAWDDRFAAGLEAAVTAMGVPLLGGDTVAVPAGSARQLGATAVGMVAEGAVPARSGAQAGDLLYVTGRIGVAGLGLALAREGVAGPAAWLDAYRRPHPRLAEGQALRARVHAMADVSDGLLIDASRMAAASGLAVAVALDVVPIAEGSPADLPGCLAAATAGDDYELLMAAPPGLTFQQPGCAQVTPVGRFASGTGLTLTWAGADVPLPDRLGYEHAQG